MKIIYSSKTHNEQKMTSSRKAEGPGFGSSIFDSHKFGKIGPKAGQASWHDQAVSERQTHQCKVMLKGKSTLDENKKHAEIPTSLPIIQKLNLRSSLYLNMH